VLRFVSDTPVLIHELPAVPRLDNVIGRTSSRFRWTLVSGRLVPTRQWL
jgi:hypothetical protein